MDRARSPVKMAVVTLVLAALAVTPAVPLRADDVYVQTANHLLASQWTPAKIGKLVFDTQVTPHWLEFSERFWYSFETTSGKRYMIVDPVKRTKAPLFDHVKLAATLTQLTLVPFDAQHLSIKSLKFINKDQAVRLELEVPKDAIIPGLKAPTPPTGPPPTQQQGGDEDDDAAADDEAAAIDEDDPQATQTTSTQTTTTQTQTQQRREVDKKEIGDKEKKDDDGDATGEGGSGRTKSVWVDYELATGKGTVYADPDGPPKKMRWASVSPDDQTIIFARGANLFVMDAANYAKAQKNPGDPTIVETQITTDGIDKNGYVGRLNGDAKRQLRRDQKGDTKHEMGPRVSSIPIVWSRDSKKFAVVRRDERKVTELWVIDHLANPRPVLETYRYAMPGEKNIAQPTIEIFDVASKAKVTVKAQRFVDQGLQITSDAPTEVNKEKEKTEPVWLSPTSDKLYFVRSSRDLHKTDICVADVATGDVKVLAEERLNTYIETKPLKLVNGGAEFVQWSERDGWAHFYLYDGNGTLKNQITSGEFVSLEAVSIDEKTRTLFFTAVGREKGEDPYYAHLYRVGLDGSGLKLVTPGDSSHAISANDAGTYFVDNTSRVNTPVASTLYDGLGAKLVDLETTDMTSLLEAGYKFPEPFKVKADDGVTDIFGVMYKPFDFDPGKKYPIIAYVYPGPQTESVTKTFSPKNQNNGLAQFGFIVIEVGNRGGNPQRSKWYHNYGYGNLRDYGLADKKAAIEQLSRRHAFIDIDRVGITGHSGGGFMSAAAMLVYPDFFKVAVSESGNHDNNVYNNTWSEKHHGIKEVEKDGETTFEYWIDKNSELAANLKGRLLLATGDIDDNVHPANTYRLTNALIKAHKRFDFFMLPGVRHSFNPVADYFFWVKGDYFARYLLGDADYQTVDIPELNREREQSGQSGRRR